MRCKLCNNLFKQEMGTLAFAKASFGKCPKCGGDSVLDEEMETKRKKRNTRKGRNMVGKNETASKKSEIKRLVTKDEFEKNYCKKSNITEAEYHENFITLPCSCGDSLCKGWACAVKNPRSIKAHRDLYMKK